MVVKTIYITRHGYREDWVNETPHLPTSRPHDPPLSKLGLKQARELGNYLQDKGIERAYCSPFYRCLQTVSPLIKDTGIPLYIDNSVAEWYGLAYPEYRLPAPIEELQEKHFPFIRTDYTSSIELPTSTETVQQCHERTKEGLDKLVEQLDKEENGPETILLVGHAASVITAIRALLNNVKYPSCPSTASLSKLIRNEKDNSWEIVMNADTTHLSDGKQRAWTFSGDVPDYEKNKKVSKEPVTV